MDCNKQKVNVLITEDWRMTVKKFIAQFGTVRNVVQMMDFGILESLLLCSPTADGWAGLGQRLLPYPPYNPDLVCLGYHPFGPLKGHMRSQHYKNDEAVHQTMCTWLWNNETNVYCTSILKLVQQWQKCLDHSWNFVEQLQATSTNWRQYLFLYMYLCFIIK
jgi:hypothetical protein